MRRIILSAVLSLSIAHPSYAKLNKAEAKMVTAVDAEYDRSVALLEKLVNQNSGSLNAPGVEKVGQMMRAEFEALGFTVQWLPMDQVKRAGHLIATHKGKGKKMLLIGHLDTVFEPASPFQTFTREGDKAIGPGVNDNKGGLVVMLTALKAMKAAGTLENTVGLI